MSYFLAPALVKFRDEVNARFPNRDKASDGWIGDPSHAARVSDHNPDWRASGRSYGIVRAIDIDISPDGRPDVDLRKVILNAAIGDDRVWYVISNGVIYSRTYGWTPRRYTGSNPHYAHVHISLRHDEAGNFDTGSWFPKPVKEKKEKDTAPRIQNFRESGNQWNVNILDRAVKLGGRRDVAPKVAAIEAAVDRLVDDKDPNTRVERFKKRFEEDRILEMKLLNDAVKEGREGNVKSVRDELRVLIKSVLRH